MVHQEEQRNLWAAVEATVRQVKNPFQAGKLPVRGWIRETCIVIGSAMIANISRIQRHLVVKTKLENKQKTDQREQEFLQEHLPVSFFLLP